MYFIVVWECDPPFFLINNSPKPCSFQGFIKISKFKYLSPPCSTGFCKIAFQDLGGFVPHRKFLKICSILRKVLFCGEGRDSRICINFEVNRLLIMVILPIVVNNRGVQILISLFMSSILLSILISVISC